MSSFDLDVFTELFQDKNIFGTKGTVFSVLYFFFHISSFVFNGYCSCRVLLLYEKTQGQRE